MARSGKGTNDPYKVPRNSTWTNIRFSWKYISDHKKLLFFAGLCQLTGCVLAVAAPIISARIIRAYVNNEAWRVMYIAFSLLVVQLLRNLCMVTGNQAYNHVYTKTLSSLEEDLVWNVLRVENHCIDEKGSGLFIQRLTTDTGRIASGFNNLADMITQVINYFGILVAMFVVDVRIFLFVLLLIVLQSIIELWRTRRLGRDDRSFRMANERFSGLVGEMVRGQKDVKFLNSEQQFSSELKGRINEANEKRLYMQSRSWRLKLLRWELGEFGSFALIALLAYLIGSNLLLPSTALILYNYYSDLGPNAVKFVGNFMDFLTDFNLSTERVSALINSPEFPKEVFGDKELKDPQGKISFNHVYFRYNSGPEAGPGPWVLQDMTLTIRPGETVALVGKSGCGKTTIFNLINKLYEPQQGQVLLDDIPLSDLTKDSIRNSITVVSQSPYIFHMSVRDNLRLTCPDASEEEMEEVCRLACIDEDIRKMPQGYDTMIGEGGVNISGGQRQRMAIARAMLRKSRIILFDEATSALDNLTQARIQEAIDNMQKDRTVVLIAHRLSTIINADRILYIEDGKVLAEGSHTQLLETCPPYRTLAEMEG